MLFFFLLLPMRPLHPHSCFMQALTLLIALLLLLSSSLQVTARLEVKGTRDYQSVKEDFLCRACVHLGEVFYDEILPPISSRYRNANRASASPASPSAPPTANAAGNEASQPQRHTPQVSHRQREQMIVEVHEAIDELCTTLDTSIQRQVVEASSITDAADADAVALQLLSPLVTSLDLREGVLTACPMALEEINEALADTAFQHLLPSEKPSASSSKATHTDDRDTASSAAQADGANASAPYELPAAGAFCERVGLCSSFVHYHITSETAVRRRAQEGHEAAKKAADATSTSSAGSASSATKTKKSAKASYSKPAKRASGSTTTAGPYAVDGKAEDETFLQTLQRVFELRTWYALKDVLNATEVASLGFWVDGLRLVVDPSVLFHLQAYVPVMGVYALTLAFLLAVVVQIVVFGCPRLPRRAERGAAGAEEKQIQTEKKVQ